MSISARTPLHPTPERGRHGYVLTESLTALAVLGIGLLPLATLAPVALGALRQYEAVAQATRAAGELAEMGDPSLALLPLHAGSVSRHQLQLCRSIASAGSEQALPGCAPGSRLAVVGSLPQPPSHVGGTGGQASLRAVALWIGP